MNIRYAFLVTLIGISLVATADQITYPHSMYYEEQQENWLESYDENQEEYWHRSYATPCIAGGVVGCVSGKISAIICRMSLTITATALMITENKAQQSIIGFAGLSTIIATLVAENKLRAKCVNWFNQNFRDYRIEHNNLVRDSAQISSWIGFLFL